MTTPRDRADELLDDPAALQELLLDPRGWLYRNGLSEADLTCTDAAHEVQARAEEVSAKANELARLPLLEALPRLHELAQAAWGDLDVARIPFGVVLAQRRPIPPVPIIDDNPTATTGTASISCTFRLSCKGDVDR